MRVTRRRFVLGLGALAIVPVTRSAFASSSQRYEVEKTDAQWKALLSPAAYAVLRHEATEPAGSSPLVNEHRRGTFLCAGCALPLFASETKFESGTGWPSFYAPIANAVLTTEDRSLFMVRTEVHCRRCGGHQGHVFKDGPPPTGLRYCINGVALSFQLAQPA